MKRTEKLTRAYDCGWRAGYHGRNIMREDFRTSEDMLLWWAGWQDGKRHRMAA